MTGPLPAVLKMNVSKPPRNLQPIAAEAINHMRLVDFPMIGRGDALVYEANRSDFILELDVSNGKQIVVEPLTRADGENTTIAWKQGRAKLDYAETVSQRIVRIRLKPLHEIGTPLLVRGVKIVRYGRTVLELAVTFPGRGEAPFEPPMSYPQDPRVMPTSVTMPSLLSKEAQRGFAASHIPGFSMSPMMFQTTDTSTAVNHYKFEGKELDDETGLYNFGARYYSPGLGRYMSPDWSARPTPIPYANIFDPQTLNLYSFGRNKPLSMREADGHCPGDDCKKVQVTVSTPEPNVVQNVPAGKVYASGVGVQPVITFADKKGHPMAGVQVKESPKTVDNLTGQLVKSNANSGTVATSANGTIKDNVVAPLRLDAQPHEVTPEDTAAMKDAANTLPYNRTTDQTLDFSVGKQQCQCTYSETLSNSDSQGNLNQQPNSNGINFTFSHTTPNVQRVEPKKDKEPK